MPVQSSIIRQECLGKCIKTTPFTIGRPSFCVHCKWCPTPDEQRDRCMFCLEDVVRQGTEVCVHCGQSQVVEAFSPHILQSFETLNIDLPAAQKTSSSFYLRSVTGLRLTFVHIAYVLVACQNSITWSDDKTKFID